MTKYIERMDTTGANCKAASWPTADWFSSLATMQSPCSWPIVIKHDGLPQTANGKSQIIKTPLFIEMLEIGDLNR
jgi:hypothetical protein